MSIIENRNMPSSMFGIQGFNPWNILFVGVFLAWVASRRREGLTWDMPGYISVLLLLYLGVILVGVTRAIFDRAFMAGFSLKYLISDHLINTVKWVLPGILLFDGCRSRKRVAIALWSILGLYLVTALLIFRNVPLSSAGSLLTMTASRGAFNKAIGYGAVTVAMMMAGGSWAVLSILPLVKRSWHKGMVICGFFMVTFTLILTSGRMGYLTWAMLGMIFGVLRWRRYLLLVPFGIMLVVVVFPGVSQRMLTGFGETNVEGEAYVDEYTVSSGRLLAWPYVIDKIKESPIIGYGRLAMPRTGLSRYLEENMIASAFGHAHNAYLELFLDNGLIGFFIVMSFFTVVIVHAFRLFRDRSDPLFMAFVYHWSGNVSTRPCPIIMLQVVCLCQFLVHTSHL
jgi:O-antigen ligase